MQDPNVSDVVGKTIKGEVDALTIRWRQDIPAHGIDKDARVLELIAAYRARGHLMADVDPLRYNNESLESHPDLNVLTYELTLWDLDRTFNVGGFHGAERLKLRKVLSVLRDAYCRHIGVEYAHILDRDERSWLQEQIEAGMPKPSNSEQKYILQKVNAAEAFENFLQTKYVGQKRFSLEGAETLIPLMDAIIDTAAGQGLDAGAGPPRRLDGALGSRGGLGHLDTDLAGGGGQLLGRGRDRLDAVRLGDRVQRLEHL